MDQTTILALAVCAAITPYLTELIKVFAPGEYSGRKALTINLGVSIVVALGVLWYQGKLVWTDPAQLFASAGLVLGIATAVYQYLTRAVQAPVAKLNNLVQQ